MKHTRAAAMSLLAALAVAAGGAGASPLFRVQNGGRVPNKDPKQMFPRWHPYTVVDAFENNGFPSSKLGNFGSLAVDSNNIVHIVGEDGFQNTALPNGIYYYSNAYDTRRGNGFSDTFTVHASVANQVSHHPDVAVGPDDSVHVVWNSVFTDPVTGFVFSDIYYRKKTSAGWQSVVPLTTATEFISYANPQIAVDATGVAQVVVDRGDTTTSSIRRITVSPFTEETAASSALDTLEKPRISIDSTNQPHVIWEHTDQTNIPPPQFITIRYSRRTGPSAWTAPAIISDGNESRRADLFVDKADANTPHFAWGRIDPLPNLVRYRKGTGGPIESVNTESIGFTLNSGVRLVVDSQKQPHVVWHNGGVSASHSYAAKINNPSPGSPTWGRQEPADVIQQAGHGPLDIAINRNDGIYLACNDGGNNLALTRTIEHNLGEQDSFASLPMGPNSSVNAANGNLFSTFPLFSSRGVGFATALSLLYNSQGWEPSVLSQGWLHNYHLYVTDSWTDINHVFPGASHFPDIITLFLGDGRSVVFQYKNKSDEIFHLAEDEFGYFSKIERTPVALVTEYKLTTKFGVVYTFRTDGKLREIRDPNQNTLTLGYSGGLLSTILDSAGRTTSLGYLNGRLDTVIDPDLPSPKQYKLIYDGNGKLMSVTLNNTGPPAEKAAWQFAYHATNDGANSKKVNLLSDLTTPRLNVHKFGYYLDNRLRSSQDPTLVSQPSLGEDGITPIPTHDPHVINYFDPASFPAPAGEPRAEITNRRANVTKVEFEQRKSLATKVTDALSKSITRTFSVDHRNLKTVIDKVGNETLYFYTHEEGTKETPLYVRDNLRRIRQPLANSPPPASATFPQGVDTATYTYINVLSRVNTVTDAFSKVTTYVYSGSGDLLEIRSPSVTGQGIAIERFTYEIPSRGRVLTQETPRNVDSGGFTQFVYDDAMVPSGLVRYIFRPQHSFPEQFTYDRMGNTKTHILPEGGITTTDYDGLYRVKTQTAPQGDESSIANFAYDSDSNVDIVTGPGSAHADHDYDELGRLIKTTAKESDARSLATAIHFDPEGNVRKVVDPRNKVSTSTFDVLDRLASDTRPGYPSPSVMTTYEYNDNGSMKTQITGPTTNRFTYSGRELLRTTINDSFPAEVDENAYFEDGSLDTALRKVSGTAVTGTKNAYDERRRLVSVTQIDNFVAMTGPTTVYTLDKNGNRAEVTDPMGRKMKFDFDLADRQIALRDHNNVVLSQVVYNENDLRKEVFVAEPETGLLRLDRKYEYNPRNETNKETDFFGNVTTHVYSAQGFLTLSQIPAVGGSFCFVSREYDFLGRVKTEVHDPGSASEIRWTYEYDENGNRNKIVDPRGQVYRMDFDDGNRLKEMHYPQVGTDSFVESWSYDVRGNLFVHIDPNGKIATMLYDGRNRSDQETHVVAGQTVADLKRLYDAKGNLLSVEDFVSKVKISYTDSGGVPAYDALNRLLQVRWFLEVGTPQEVMWKTLQYRKPDTSPGYDAAGNLTHMTDPEGHQFEYVYNVLNQLTDIKRTPSGGSPVTLVSYAYYVSGLRKEALLQGGTKQTMHYDVKSRLTSIETANGSGSILARFDYEYDARDRRSKGKIEHLQNEIAYTYDCHDRLTGETWTGNGSPPPACSNVLQTLPVGNISNASPSAIAVPGSGPPVPIYAASWTYDPAGNRLTKTVNGLLTNYTYDEQNRLTAESGGTVVAYTYDKNGNQLTRTQGGVIETFSYDFKNRVKTYQKGSTVSFLYRYTPTDERLAKIDLLGSSNNEEWFMVDGADVTADYTRSSGSPTYTLARTYANGRAIDSKVARIESNGTTYFYVGDALGSVHELVNTTGTVINRSLYTAWGEDLPGFPPLAGLPERYSFTQRERNQETAGASGTGYQDNRARWYDPRTGRLIQQDPIRALRPIEHYKYADNNPLTYRDPFGTDRLREQVDPETDLIILKYINEGFYSDDPQVDIGVFDPTTSQVMIFKGENDPPVSVPKAEIENHIRGILWDSGPNSTEAWYDWAKSWRDSQGKSQYHSGTALGASREVIRGQGYATVQAARPDWENTYRSVLGGVQQAGTDVLLNLIPQGKGITLAGFVAGVRKAKVATRVSRIVRTGGTSGRVATATAKMLPIPKVTNPKLRNIVNDLYKGARGANPIGTGSTADAIRNELSTGLPTHGVFHSDKGKQYINALDSWLRNNPNESDYDKLVAESLKRDLQGALGGN